MPEKFPYGKRFYRLSRSSQKIEHEGIYILGNSLSTQSEKQISNS
jgi:hypothetical protein